MCIFMPMFLVMNIDNTVAAKAEEEEEGREETVEGV